MHILEPEDRKNICGVRIRESRKARIPVLTQKDLAARLELDGIMLDRMAINRIELGNRFVSDIELLALSKALGVSVNWLVFGKN
jgi:transcriptional regulator with XRE-family HTH domain